ncbi:MAG: AsmA-like C-terminal region-containing protein [Ginsengibacter sp.]
MKKIWKYLVKAFLIFFGLLILSYIILIAYVSTHKKSIIKEVTQEVGKRISGNVSIGDIDLSFFQTFPRVSVLLNKVVITDSMFAKYNHKFFEGDEVFAQISITRLLKKEFAISGLRIVNANIYLFTDTTGYSNDYLFKFKKIDSAAHNKTPGKSELKTIGLKNVGFIIDNRQNEKLYNILANKLNIKIDDTDSSFFVSAKTDLLIHNLSFNLEKGSFLKEKTFEGNFDLKLNKSNQQLRADSINLEIAGHPFNLSAVFDLKGPQPQFELRIHTKDILYSFAKSLLPEKISQALSIVDLDKKFDADADINGPLKGGDPVVVARWVVRGSHLTTPFFDFDNADFTGFYTNEVEKNLPRKDPNSKINIDHFSASWNGFAMSSNNIEIINLYKPLLIADLKSDFSLSTLNDILGSNSIQLTNGKGSASLTYKGPLEKNNSTNSFLNGEMTFSNGTIFYTPRSVEMKNVNGKLIINNSNVLVQNLQCEVLNNKVTMNGRANNLLTLINTEPNKANIDWDIYSPSLNLSSFLYLLKSRKIEKSNRNKKAKLAKVSDEIDGILDRGSLNVNLKADRLIYKKFEAENVNANVTLLPESYVIHKMSMRHGGGSLDLSGSLVNRNSNFHQFTFNSTLNNVDVNKIFTAFNNFGQAGIEAKNLEGKLDAKISGALGLNDDGKAYSNSIASTIDFSLKDGALKNFEPIEKMQNIFFKNRNFQNIQFAELKDRLEIANEEIKINRMEIASSVFTIFVEGTYGLKGNSDVSIQIPFSNLKKRNADYKPENSGLNKKVGSSLYLRGRTGPDGNIQFKTDLFNRFKKDK